MAAISVEALSNVSITGWYSPPCLDREYLPKFEDYCVSHMLHRLEQPISLDPSGQTCYVNPWHNTFVFWAGPGTDNSGNVQATLFGMHFTNETIAELYLSDCSEFGICSCDDLEFIRQTWMNNPNGNWCTLTEHVDICLESKMTNVGFLLDVEKGDYCQPLIQGFDNADFSFGAINYGDTTGIVCTAAVQLLLGERGTIPPTGAPTSSAWMTRLTFPFVAGVLTAVIAQAHLGVYVV